MNSFNWNDRFSRNKLLWSGLFTMCYLVWAMLIMEPRTEHFYVLGLIVLMFFLTKTTHQFVLGFGFFITFVICYDSLQLVPNYEVNQINIEEPYNIEKSFFGIDTEDGRLTPNEYIKANGNTFLYVLSGIFYLFWIPGPMLFGIYLFIKKKRKLLIHFWAAFLVTNFVGFIIYYLYPAAPPWYVDMHGFQENFSIPGNEAGLAVFDEFFNVGIYNGMYAKNSNVFAAVPSLHAAYPTVLFYYGMKLKNSIINALFLLILLGIWFAAVYSMHHYVIDVILGILCTVTGILIFEKVILKSKLSHLLDKYANYISA